MTLSGRSSSTDKPTGKAGSTEWPETDREVLQARDSQSAPGEEPGGTNPPGHHRSEQVGRGPGIFGQFEMKNMFLLLTSAHC